ncbi:MAG TPA: phenylacetate--CoA ligase family protein, partial [Chitinophagales bacterium]|nr:phenylacetate--CoA ligase family protein [Chitinophagales bacterium]
MTSTPLTLTEIGNYQNTKLKEQLAYLKANSPYYQRLFAEHKVDVGSIASVAGLVDIPTTTKEDFSNYNFDFLCVPRNKVVDYTTTSGTTGSPVTVALTEADLQRLAYNE